MGFSSVERRELESGDSIRETELSEAGEEEKNDGTQCLRWSPLCRKSQRSFREGSGPHDPSPESLILKPQVEIDERCELPSPVRSGAQAIKLKDLPTVTSSGLMGVRGESEAIR